MKPRTIKYYIKEGFKSLIKNRLMSVASIVTVAVCIFIVAVSYCITVNISYMLQQVENSIGISAFAQDNLDSDKLSEILDNIQSIPHVDNVKYISPEEGLKNMQENLGDDQDILSGLAEDNPLSASFNVTVDDANYQKSVVEALEKIDGIRKVKNALTLTDALISISKTVYIISTVVISVLCVVSIVIIINTIKLAVYIRKSEINIMKYVGATDWFIRWPFIIEGTLIGLIGSAIPVLICILGYNPAVEKISSFPIINQLVQFKPSEEIFYKIVPVAIVVGIVIGTLGSTFSVRKHLHV